MDIANIRCEGEVSI